MRPIRAWLLREGREDLGPFVGPDVRVGDAASNGRVGVEAALKDVLKEGRMSSSVSGTVCRVDPSSGDISGW